MFLKAVISWLLIALAETLHGILRVRFLNRRLGDRRARQVSVISGSMIVLTIGWLTVPWVHSESIPRAFAIGAIWLALMLAFDLGLGRYYFHFSWRRLASDFDLLKGGYLGIGMIILFLTPLIISKLRALF